MNTEEIKKLGLEMAAKCHWKKEEILQVAAAALDDANFHYEALDVLELVDADYEPKV